MLKLFTLYERRVGEGYWSGRIAKTFERPEIQRMATMFAAVEENSHAPFYNKVNEVLYLDTEEFYESWKEVEELSKRMGFVAKAVSNPEDALSFAAFTFIEGAVLYSSFAFLKHFQAQECGKDLMRNICRGVDLSVADEHTHSVGGALLFNTVHDEAVKNLGVNIRELFKEEIIKMAHEVYEHESGIIDLIFEYEINGITKHQLREFVKHRVNLCLNNLGYPSIFVIEDASIEKWFYQSINSKTFHDFFSGSGSEYNINWNRVGFDVWSKK